MERKELMGGNKSPSNEDTASSVGRSVHHTWDQGRVSSASELFERLNQIPANQVNVQAQRELSASEFLEFLRKQGPEGQFRNVRSMTADGSSQGSPSKSQSIHDKDRNTVYQSVAIDQCDITSSVDYGSRDYYHPSTHTSQTSRVYKENELDELYKASTDTRGNWWEGSFYY